MRVPTLLVSLLCILPNLVATHGDIAGAPRIFGRRTTSELKSRRALAVRSHDFQETHELVKRAQGDTCGPRIGSCAAGLCCSGAGYCGTGQQFCAAPDCLFNYGPACDANTTPSGESTSSIARPKLGSVLYGSEGVIGGGVYDCVVPGTIAITYDDGPYIYTAEVLDLLKQYKAKATFFITGNNLGKGQIDSTAYPWAALIKRMYAEGHQIASHTWSHPDLSTLDTPQREHEMYSNEMALRNILGFFPTYMRPPYSSCNAACSTDMERLGYHITYFDLDTEDYLNDSPTMIQKPKNNFLGNISSKAATDSDWLVIGHDVHEQTAHNLTLFMLQNLQQQGFKPVTVGECLGDPQINWYRSSAGSLSPPSAPSTPVSVPTNTAATPPVSPPLFPTNSSEIVSTDATCGGAAGYTCLKSKYGNCCSRNGYCGASNAFCGSGCNSAFAVGLPRVKLAQGRHSANAARGMAFAARQQFIATLDA
ncbi:hypothetical protein EG328_003566 [Venturia inaequalis]|uniref:Chitin deacetylase n=1 Tax=Venturia inaequalis TaxID=5025 RepID=A0A8H3UU98_VENIN|nr:hypothetical protein EG328_003566 [Venturia inaequalis]